MTTELTESYPSNVLACVLPERPPMPDWVGEFHEYVPGDGLRVVAFTDDQHHRSELDDMTAGQVRALAAVLMSAADRLDRLANSQHSHNPGRTTR